MMSVIDEAKECLLNTYTLFKASSGVEQDVYPAEPIQTIMRKLIAECERLESENKKLRRERYMMAVLSAQPEALNKEVEDMRNKIIDEVIKE